VSGLADGIIDLVDTGRTLEENHLVPRLKIADSTARLICNPVAYSRKSPRVADLVGRISDGLSQSGDV
jgi:ATP phosphoribosyltransferase